MNFRNLLEYIFQISLVSNDVNIFGRTYCEETLIRLTNKSLPGSEDINKLFWKIISTHWPETASNSAGHDNTVIVLHQVM